MLEVVRPKGTIYFCNDRLVTSHVTQSEAALVTYQAPGTSSCVGLDCDCTGRAIETEILAGAWYLAEKDFRRVDRDGQDVAFRDSVLRIPLFIHEPDEDLRREFRDSDGYFRNLAVHKLRARYGKESSPPVPTDVIRSYSRHQDFGFTALTTDLAAKCAFLTLWPLSGSGFGWHFIVFNGRQSFDVDFLPKLAEQFDCNWLKVSSTALPQN